MDLIELVIDGSAKYMDESRIETHEMHHAFGFGGQVAFWKCIQARAIIEIKMMTIFLSKTSQK